jgi:hypothetical protein
MKIVMVLFSVMVAAVTCHQNFTIIFMKGGIGKNGATVAVSIPLHFQHSLD